MMDHRSRTLVGTLAARLFLSFGVNSISIAQAFTTPSLGIFRPAVVSTARRQLSLSTSSSAATGSTRGLGSARPFSSVSVTTTSISITTTSLNNAAPSEFDYSSVSDITGSPGASVNQTTSVTAVDVSTDTVTETVSNAAMTGMTATVTAMNDAQDALAVAAADALFEQAINESAVPATTAELVDPFEALNAEVLNSISDALNSISDGIHTTAGTIDSTASSEPTAPATTAANDTTVTTDTTATTDTTTSTTEPPNPKAVKEYAAKVSSAILSIDPATVDIVTIEAEENTTNGSAGNQDPLHMDMMQRLPFVNMFRGSANYIANHRNTLAVYHIPGGLLDMPDPTDTVFRDLMNDIALTWLLGMKIVLVVGCRHQIEKRVKGQVRQHGLRVTDEDTLRVVKEEAGFVRFEVERQLARSLRLQGGGASGANGYYDGNVVSGNFYSAQPFGILDGTDFKFTGFVRRVEVEKIRQVHTSRDICLLTTLGVSPSGEVFNVNSESLAAAVAGQMEASKVIYFTEQEMELTSNVHGNKIQSLRLSDAKNLLKHHGVTVHKRGFVELNSEAPPDVSVEAVDMLLKIGWSMEAIVSGVKRAHIISPKHGSLLQELYTRDGSGVLVSADLYEGIRQANVHDVSSIYDLISPLIQMGTLIDRPKNVLEKDVDQYYVYTRDDHIVACGQLKLFKEGFAEIGCLVVSKDYRSRGRGDAMLGYLERLSLLNGCSSIFVLSTQTMEWFAERGFDLSGSDRLPPSRPYNHKRASKIYMKKIESARDLDASELWWNR